MPQSKKRSASSEDEGTSTKKSKISPSKASALSIGVMKKDSDGNEYWELAGKKRVVISEFKGTKMVSIREYYEKDGQDLPGKKGISLPVAQFGALITLIPQIESILGEKGEDLPRPDYNGIEVMQQGKSDGDEEEKPASKRKKGRQNFEETSEEE